MGGGALASGAVSSCFGRSISRGVRNQRLGKALGLAGVLAVWLWSPAASAQAGEPPTSVGDAEGVAPRAPVIVPPQLVYFHEADYPPAAFEAGLEAEVVLKLLVQDDGTVGEVEVVEPVGHGFEEAAVAAARRFVFTPAQRDGRPVPVYIQYAYRFEALEAEVAVEAPTAVTGNLEGRLFIGGTEAALAGASVSITDSEGRRTEVVTDTEGSWVTAGLEPGSYRVVVTAPGYDSIELTEEVVAGEATALVYRIAREAEGLEIVVTGERPPREVTRRTLERREITKIPGTSGDALRSLQSLPGVARPPASAGLLIVRGSAPQDTNIFIDGALVPIVYHFGGLSSVVPTELLERIDFYPGNFSARYGRVMGGVVDVALRSPPTECTGDYATPTGEDGCLRGMAQVDLIDGRVMLSGGISDEWSFALAGRRSWVDTWLKPVLEASGAGVTTAPVYYDYQALLEYRPSTKQRARLQFYGSDDALRVLVSNPVAQDPAFSGSAELETSFYRVQLLYEQQLASDWRLDTSLAAGRDRLYFAIGPIIFDIEQYPVTLRSELSYQPTAGLTFNAGLDFLAAPYDVRVRAPLPPQPGEPDPGPFTGKPLLDTSESATAFRPAWYAEAEWQATDRLSVVPGVRVDFARDSGHADLAPRINARYTLRGLESDDGSSTLRTTLKGGAGYFYQPPQFQEVNQVFGTPNLESNRSLHFALGVEQELSERIELSVEGYYKDLSNLVAGASGLQTGYANRGVGAVIGAETLLKFKPGPRFFGWVAYTLSRSTRQNGPDEPEYLFQFDQTHILTALGSYRLGDGWEVGARFRLVSGNLHTPVLGFPALGALYNADAGAYVPLQGPMNSERLPLFHQLDIRLEKTWQFRHWRLMAYLDIWNAYNHQAVEGVQYNFDYSNRAPQTGLPIIPSLGLRGEF